MPRPIWQGQISFGLVNIPVSLFSAEKRADIQFHLLDSKDHNRIRYERVNEITGREVPWDQVVKAYEYDKEHYVVLENEDFQRAAVESSQTIEIEHFVNEKEVDYIYFERPYYLVPDKKNKKGYVLLRETLKRAKKIGIAKVVIRTRQYLAAIIPVGHALVLDLLRFDQELRKASEFDLPKESTQSYKIAAKEFQIAEQLVEAMTAKFEPQKYHDDYRDALMKFIEKKEKGRPLPKKPATQATGGAKVIDFMALLKKSIEAKKKKAKARVRTK